MKIRDSIYGFPGFHRPALAHLRVYKHKGSTVAIVGELTDNRSTSVTNQIEVIVEQLRGEYGQSVIVIEHHPPAEDLRTEPIWDTVVDGADPRVPNWPRLSIDDVQMLVGEAVELWPEKDYTTATLILGGTTAP